jgi:hypothetical protein
MSIANEIPATNPPAMAVREFGAGRLIGKSHFGHWALYPLHAEHPAARC